MIQPKEFYQWLHEQKIGFFSGVPDSLLKDLCAYITDNTLGRNHIIAANEGNAVALASGNHLATGTIPAVYMQNSGLGNTVNPLLSLANNKVYQIPLLLLIGWRGEPGVKDEPQHVTQGEVTLKLLDAMKIPFQVLGKEKEQAKKQVLEVIQQIRETNSPVAIIIRKGTFDKYVIKEKIDAGYSLNREDAIKQIVGQFSGDEVVVSTTGKTSRELFECRAALGQKHSSDFLTVGSMGHASQIALGIALAKPNRKVVCLDGDGALLMHMGAMSIIGNMQPKNFLHFVINNGAHESVGGQPTAAFGMDIPAIAKANNYKSVQSVSTGIDLDNALQSIPKDAYPALIEIKVKVGARKDLGRPTIKPVDNKKDFMNNLRS